MKIQELQQREIEHLRTAKHGSKLDDYLTQNGWNELTYGATAYSNVWEKSGSKWIIKILRQSVEPTPAFKCAVQWLRWAQKNHHTNPHVPVVAYVKTVPGEFEEGERAYMAVMERLIDSDSYDWEPSGNRREDTFMVACQYYLGLSGTLKWTEESLDTVFMDIIAEVGGTDEIIKATKYMGHTSDFDGSESSEEYLRWLSVMSRKTDIRPNLARRMVRYGAFKGHPLSKVISTIMDMGCRLDFHSGNVMVRPGTNTLVITDPVAG